MIQPFDNEIIIRMKEHALSEYQKEAVGYIANDRYYEAVNSSDDPINKFKFSYQSLIEAENNNVKCFVHSHPEGADYPTQKDQLFCITSGVPHGITRLYKDSSGEIFIQEPFFWGDQLPITPLLGREYRHAVYDCYSLIRDYYRLEKGILLTHCARRNDWWNKGEDLYLQNFERGGFIRIGEKEVKEGDVILAQIRSPVTNHGGIYMGNSQVLHHLHRRCSKKDNILPWKKYVTHYLRFVGPAPFI